jgi:hypothetical protein
MMKREMRVSRGAVPHSLFGDELDEASWQMLGSEFLLRGEGEHYFHYRKGQGVRIERGADADEREEALWLDGSVYAAIASLNGLLPVHASAIAYDGSVFAFSGPAGAGKSTLVAALGDLGFPMFCDDTLVLDLSNSSNIVCLPGHKRLKLSLDALNLTGAKAAERVSPTVSKCFASPAAGEVEEALPLGQLIMLEASEDCSIAPILGGEKLRELNDDHQTSRLYASARQFDRAGLFGHLAKLSMRIDMWRFRRPLDRLRFREGVELIVKHVANHPGGRSA